MSTEQKTNTKTNTVRIVGYLKENNLELVKTSKGDEVIRGSLIIATSDVESHRVQFYANKTNKSGEVSKDFERLCTLLPENTISIAGFLKANRSATFATASAAASKIWVIGRFEEFASKVGEREKSMITIKGFRGGFKNCNEDGTFTTTAEFTTDVFIDTIDNELDDKGSSTGRLILNCVMPMYGDMVQKISFVAPSEENIAIYISANYKPTDTVTLKGDIISLQEKIIKNEGTSDDFFGRSDVVQYETKFVRERRIAGGSKTPIKQGEDGAIAVDYVKKGLASRELKMIENGKKDKKPSPSAKVDSISSESENASTSVQSKTKVDEFDF